MNLFPWFSPKNIPIVNKERIPNTIIDEIKYLFNLLDIIIFHLQVFCIFIIYMIPIDSNYVKLRKNI